MKKSLLALVCALFSLPSFAQQPTPAQTLDSPIGTVPMVVGKTGGFTVYGGSHLSDNGTALLYKGVPINLQTPLAIGTTVTLIAPRQYFICTGTCTVTVPVPTAGNEFCVLNDVGVSSVITLSAIGSSAQYGKTDQSAYGTAGTGTFVSGGAVGDKVCLLGKDATHYNTASFSGTWTAN
jgi:hypothetical protein